MSRFRTFQSDPQVIPTLGKWRQRASSSHIWGPWSASYQGSASFTDSKEMTDTKTPGYFKAKREGGLLPTSPMSQSSFEHIVVPGASTFVVRRLSNGSEVEIDLTGYYRGDAAVAVAPAMPDLDSAIPVQEALARAQSDAWDALTWLAEFRSTLETITGFRERVDRLYDRFSTTVNARSRGVKYVDRAKLISEVWLELRYAWRPMIYDMQDINEAIKRLQMGIEDPLCRAYGNLAKDSTVSSGTLSQGNIIIPGFGSWGLGGVVMRSNLHCVASRSLHAAVGVQVTTRDVLMGDLFVTAWELTPFSFILDWFVTIGDMLTAFSPFASGSLRYATVSDTALYEFTSSFYVAPASGYQLITGSVVPVVRNTKQREYSRVDAVPTPTIGIAVNLDAFKIIDLLALWLGRNAFHLRRILRHV